MSSLAMIVPFSYIVSLSNIAFFMLSHVESYIHGHMV